MSRTWAALVSKLAASSSGRPKSLTSIAPDTLKRSVMTMFISALTSRPSRIIEPTRWPTRRAGIKKIGKSNSATRVICHDSTNIVASTMTTSTALPTTFESRSVKACCAPITSLLSRLISAPVWVREKNAIGIDWMWRNTLDRMS